MRYKEKEIMRYKKRERERGYKRDIQWLTDITDNRLEYNVLNKQTHRHKSSIRYRIKSFSPQHVFLLRFSSFVSSS